MLRLRIRRIVSRVKWVCHVFSSDVVWGKEGVVVTFFMVGVAWWKRA